MPNSTPVTVVMPDDQKLVGQQPADDLASAIAAHVQDDIEDARLLRHLRPPLAKGMICATIVFYAALLATIGYIVLNDSAAYRVQCAPTVAITIIIVLAAVPTLILIGVARAVFGKRNSADFPYSPLQAIIHLMKEMKGG